MVNPFIICGGNSFPREDDQEEHDKLEREVKSADSSPKRSWSKCKSTRSNGHKNPYSDRGLDKFSALLAEMEEKREKIYSQFPPEEIAFVQFDFSNGNNGKPIVVKAAKQRDYEEEKIDDHNDNIQNHKSTTMTPPPDHRRKHHSGPLLGYNQYYRRRCVIDEYSHNDLASSSKTNIITEVEKKLSTTCDQVQHFKKKKMRKPEFYMSITLILILVFLALFGRSVAIMCTSISWYLMSTVGNSVGPELKRKSSKKKVSLLGSTTSLAKVGPHLPHSRFSSALTSSK